MRKLSDGEAVLRSICVCLELCFSLKAAIFYYCLNLGSYLYIFYYIPMAFLNILKVESMHCLVLCVPNSSAMAVAVWRASLLKHQCGYPCCEHRTEVNRAVAAGVS